MAPPCSVSQGSVKGVTQRRQKGKDKKEKGKR